MFIHQCYEVRILLQLCTKIFNFFFCSSAGVRAQINSSNIFTYAPCVQLERYIRLKSIFPTASLRLSSLSSSFVFSFQFFFAASPVLGCLLIYYVQKKNCYRWSIFNFFFRFVLAQESAKKEFITKYAHTGFGVDPRLFFNDFSLLVRLCCFF